MIFPVIKTDNIAQINDKLRIDVSKSYQASGSESITEIRIKPELTGDFTIIGNLDDTETWYLDWQYSTEGTKTITLEIDDDTPLTSTVTCEIEVLTEQDDKLFSIDNDLLAFEPDFLKWLPCYRISYKYWHRQAQKNILDYLNNNGYTNTSGARLTKDNILDVTEVKDWSTFNVLKTVFEGISNSTDDVFAEKSNVYRELENNAKEKSVLRLDTNGDGETTKRVTLLTAELTRR